MKGNSIFGKNKDKSTSQKKKALNREDVSKSLGDKAKSSEERIGSISDADNLAKDVDDISTNIDSISEGKVTISSNLYNRYDGVLEWHKRQDDIISSFRKVQPDISNVLKIIMDFPRELTTNYIYEFGNILIRQYNLVFDMYVYHQAKEDSADDEYKKAINGYKVLMDNIVDDLSEIGFEEISSQEETMFDNSIHEVVNVDLINPSKAIVSKSIRSGFRYQGAVIQKEKVCVGE